jgi:hypothetical protein
MAILGLGGRGADHMKLTAQVPRVRAAIWACQAGTHVHRGKAGLS